MKIICGAKHPYHPLNLRLCDLNTFVPVLNSTNEITRIKLYKSKSYFMKKKKKIANRIVLFMEGLRTYSKCHKTWFTGEIMNFEFYLYA